MHYATGNGPKTIGMLPRGFSARLEFFNAQLGRTENDVLAVIEFPILRQDSTFGLQSFVEGSIWKRRNDGKPRQVNAGLNGKLGGFQKCVRLVVIESENEAALQSDPMLMEHFNNLCKTIGRIKSLMTIA
jgi:hypothetical protein